MKTIRTLTAGALLTAGVLALGISSVSAQRGVQPPAAPRNAGGFGSNGSVTLPTKPPPPPGRDTGIPIKKRPPNVDVNTQFESFRPK